MDGNDELVENLSDTSLSTRGRGKLMSWINDVLKITMTDGRVLVGNFFCTDRDSNVILGLSEEYLKEEDVGVEQPRVLGLVMIPGRHIVSIHYRNPQINNLAKINN